LKWKASFDNQSKALLSSWNIGNKHCNWMGITCDESKSICDVNLADIRLRGTLQSLNFSSLTNFRSLVLKHNSFYGVVPQHIGVISNLDTLNLSLNGFPGCIPKNIGNLSNYPILILVSIIWIALSLFLEESCPICQISG
jgi:hypothetical protein